MEVKFNSSQATNFSAVDVLMSGEEFVECNGVCVN